jgi:hypothetical protein
MACQEKFRPADPLEFEQMVKDDYFLVGGIYRRKE